MSSCIHNYYRYQSTVERRDDEEWAEFAQGQMEEILEEEGLECQFIHFLASAFMRMQSNSLPLSF